MTGTPKLKLQLESQRSSQREAQCGVTGLREVVAQ